MSMRIAMMSLMTVVSAVALAPLALAQEEAVRPETAMEQNRRQMERIERALRQQEELEAPEARRLQRQRELLTQQLQRAEERENELSRKAEAVRMDLRELERLSAELPENAGARREEVTRKLDNLRGSPKSNAPALRIGSAPDPKQSARNL